VKANLADICAVVSDIDYTLVDFGKGHQAAIEALAGIFGRHLANEVSKIFHLVLEGLRRTEDADWEERQAFQDVLEQIKRFQAPWLAMYGIKPWSREAWIIIAAQQLQMTLSPHLVEAGRDVYWQALSNNAALYKSAYKFLENLREARIPLILMTSSDSICRVAADYTVKYDPVYSQQYKRKRLKQLPLQYQDLVIGDPIDKPDSRFFDRVFQVVATFGNFPMENILFVGDSEKSDLQEPGRRGCRTLLATQNED
jgi:FMN phosphatase YigB (HAD superfamily)